MVQKSAAIKNADIKKEGFLYNIKKHKCLYLMMLPAIISALLFGYKPLCGIIIAFEDFNIMSGVFGSKWVGFANFQQIFSHPQMLGAIKNTLVYGAVNLFGGFLFPVVLALLFNELRCMRFKKTIQTVAYMPHFLSWISVIGILYGFFAIDGPYNNLVKAILGDGYVPKNLLLDPDNFLGFLFWSGIWKSIGWSSIVYLAAITGIDQSLYEAADVDGCGKIRKTWSITLPSILPTMVVVFIMSLGGLVNQNFDQVFGLQNVFTQDKTEVINTLIYRMGIQNGKYSLATAFGLAQGLITLGLMIFGNFVSKKVTKVGIM